MQLSLVVLMVTLIHFIEAYGLNPAIYSAHLKLHPLLVLTVLVVAEHSLGVWGLLLAGEIVRTTLTFLMKSICSIRLQKIHSAELSGVCLSDSLILPCACNDPDPLLVVQSQSQCTPWTT